jgi:hypothetical protein
MLIEAGLLPTNLSSHLFFSLVIYYGSSSSSGSAKAKSYGVYGSGSATLLLIQPRQRLIHTRLSRVKTRLHLIHKLRKTRFVS